MLKIRTAMDSSWQAFKVAEVGNSRWVIWGVQVCYFNVKYTQKGKAYGNRFEDNWRLSSQFKHLHFLKCDGNFLSSKNISQKHQANMSFLWKLFNLFLPDLQGLFWAALDFPKSQDLLTFLSIQWIKNLFPSWRCPGGHKKELVGTGSVDYTNTHNVLWDRKILINWRKQATLFCFPKVSCSCTAVCGAGKTCAFVGFFPW